MNLERLIASIIEAIVSGAFSSKKSHRKSFERVITREGIGALVALGTAGAYAMTKAASASSSASGTPPPPLAPSRPTPPPPPPAQQSPNDRDMLLIVRAMIAAANADHHIDDDERRSILAKFEALGLGDDERRFVHHELDQPITIAALAREVGGNASLSRQVYLASLLVTQVDTEAERQYFARLAQALAIPPSEVRELEEKAAI